MSILGLHFLKDEAFVTKLAEYWYIAVALGVLVFAACFKIDKPKLDE
jgi:hypothetical protein